MRPGGTGTIKMIETKLGKNENNLLKKWQRDYIDLFIKIKNGAETILIIIPIAEKLEIDPYLSAPQMER